MLKCSKSAGSLSCNLSSGTIMFVNETHLSYCSFARTAAIFTGVT